MPDIEQVSPLHSFRKRSADEEEDMQEYEDEGYEEVVVRPKEKKRKVAVLNGGVGGC